MSVLEYLEPLSADHASVVGLDDLEDAFRAWAHDPAKPDVVGIDRDRELAILELARRLRGSRVTLPGATCTQFGLPPGTTMATAARELLLATIDPDGSRCRSFRSASFYLRGRADLDGDSDVR